MSWRFGGRVAVVTGAASGIGAALVRDLAGRGCRVALVDRDGDGLARVAAAMGWGAGGGEGHGAGISLHPLDVTDGDAVATLPGAVLARHGRVDVLVNNAGIAAMGRFDETDAATFDRVIAVNFGSVVAMTRAFLPHLDEHARIANLSSIFGIVAPAGQVPYAASKFAVRGFTEALRHELADTGIKVTCVHPGGVRTAIADSALIADDIPAARARAAQEAFGTFLRLSPETAATAIADAIARGRARVLIGNDARLGDLVSRLSPGGYGRFLALAMGGLKRHVGRRPATVRGALA